MNESKVKREQEVRQAGRKNWREKIETDGELRSQARSQEGK